MRISDLGRYVLGICAAAMFAGCGGGSRTPLSPSAAGLAAVRTHVTPLYSVIYSFKGGKQDGALPYDRPTRVSNVLYGTTVEGGGSGCFQMAGCGTLFRITTSGAETLIHSFRGGSKDGANPFVRPLSAHSGPFDVLYGSTESAGEHGKGTIFTSTGANKEAVLHSFNGVEGADPQAALIEVNGAFFGTTYFGGAHRGGTAFAITTSGKETLLHSFGAPGDGGDPQGELIDVNGALYGTTYNGGSNGVGTVFRMTTSGKETVLHSFGAPADGAVPMAGLIDVNGTLYGTTSSGGNACASGIICGTVFAITISGMESVIYNFKGGPGDGSSPQAELTDVNGTLYGTTFGGGAQCKIGSGSYPQGCGTVFKVTTSGKETVLHSFGSGKDGRFPAAGLVKINGLLYGTTTFGGTGKCSGGSQVIGCGTVFALSP